MQAESGHHVTSMTSESCRSLWRLYVDAAGDIGQHSFPGHRGCSSPRGCPGKSSKGELLDHTGATVRRLAPVRSSNFSRRLAEVQSLNQFGRLNIHRQLTNNINPINTAKPLWEGMDTVGVGVEKSRAKRLYPALPDLPCIPFIFALSKCITLAMLRLKVCSRNARPLILISRGTDSATSRLLKNPKRALVHHR